MTSFRTWRGLGESGVSGEAHSVECRRCKAKAESLRQFAKKLDSAVFPGTQGGPLMHVIAAKAVRITVNKNAIPGDDAKASVTSGIRLGTAAVTTRGFRASEMDEIADCIHAIAVDPEASRENVLFRVAAMTAAHPLYPEEESLQTAFPALNGIGNAKAGHEKFYLELADKDFWEWLIGFPDFYTKIVSFMGTRPDAYAQEFEEAYNKAENRMIREFTVKYCYCTQDGSIDWDELIKFNSGD